MIRFRITTKTGEVLEGPIQGNGGFLGGGSLYLGPAAARREAARQIKQIKLHAEQGRAPTWYEPEPLHMSVHTDNGRVAVSILDSTFEVIQKDEEKNS